MAFFKTVDLLKRNNAEILLEIVAENGVMTIGKMASGLKSKVTSLMIGLALCFDRDELCQYCETTRGAPPVLFVNETWLPITRFFKDSRFSPKPRSKSAPEVRDKEFQQRQERALVDAINTWTTPLQIDNFAYRITRARQAPTYGDHGKENLVDVVVWDETDISYNVSCKMSKAPDIGSGGISGLQRTVPDLVTRLYSQAKNDLYNLGFWEGMTFHVNDIPPIFYSIPQTYVLKMFQGSADAGGMIDYFYIGPETVKITNGKFNGDFYPVEQYALKKPFYLRLRKRNVFNSTVKINFTKVGPNGLPFIFSSGPNDFAAARFVVSDIVPSTAVMRNL